jgi:hypothetical protein
VMESTPEATEAVAKASAFLATLGLDHEPAVSCRQVAKESIEEMLRDADPNGVTYETGVRLSFTMRDRWAVHFAKKLPDGVIECPTPIIVLVFDDTGEVRLAGFPA